jgi:hypothetical protein
MVLSKEGILPFLRIFFTRALLPLNNKRFFIRALKFSFLNSEKYFLNLIQG